MSTLNDFAIRYTAAWCSHSAASVAAHFAERGSLTINGGEPASGRFAITAAAQGFMTAFPDMVVKMDRVEVDGSHIGYHWTLTGTQKGKRPSGEIATERVSGDIPMVPRDFPLRSNQVKCLFCGVERHFYSLDEQLLPGAPIVPITAEICRASGRC
jgi:hypothetical protein